MVKFINPNQNLMKACKDINPTNERMCVPSCPEALNHNVL